MKRFEYPIKILEDKLYEMKRDLFFIDNNVLNQRYRQLDLAIKALKEGVGYLGPCKYNIGLRFIPYDDNARE